MGDVNGLKGKVIGVVVCDFLRTGIGTRSRLGEDFCGVNVLERVVGRMLEVVGVEEVILLVPGEQMERTQGLRSLGFGERLFVRPLVRRGVDLEERVRVGRAWGLSSWRGGAGQWTFFDEEYHPAGIAAAAKEFGAGHVLIVNSHSVFLDVELTSKLVHHHLYKNHEMRLTFAPSAPGLSGMVLQGDVVMEMGVKGVMPCQLLGYDPKMPTFDTLVRDACMQVDPALSKIPNRFCVDTDRSWAVGERLMGRAFGSLAEIAIEAARGVAPGVVELGKVDRFPREVEVELTGRRLTNGPGSVPVVVREGRGELDASVWEEWFGRQRLWDDVTVTFGGDGDPVMYSSLVRVLRAARKAGVMSICVMTDLLGNVDGLLEGVKEGMVDVVSVVVYGGTSETYLKVGKVDGFGEMMGNFGKLASVINERGGLGVPLVVPRLVKVRETIPEMEGFFDLWVQQAGWAVIEGPTDRAGGIPFEAVVDMGPMKRKACRRIWERMLVRSNGVGVACTEDMMDLLTVGRIDGMTIEEMWGGEAFSALRKAHAGGGWGAIEPCKTCREWYRA